jgi:hypothetical protein
MQESVVLPVLSPVCLGVTYTPCPALKQSGAPALFDIVESYIVELYLIAQHIDRFCGRETRQAPKYA